MVVAVGLSLTMGLGAGCGGDVRAVRSQLGSPPPDEYTVVPPAMMTYILGDDMLLENRDNSGLVSTGTMATVCNSALAVTFLGEVAMFRNSLVYLMAGSGERAMLIANFSQASDPFGEGGPYGSGETFILRYAASEEVRRFSCGTDLRLGVLANAYDPATDTVIGWPQLPSLSDPCQNGKENNGLVNAYLTDPALNPESCYGPTPLAEHFKIMAMSWPGFLGGEPFVGVFWEDLRRDAIDRKVNGVEVDPYVVDHDFNDGGVALQFRPLQPTACGARSPGFWGGPGLGLVGAEDLAQLAALHLRDSAGGDFDPLTTDELGGWLRSASAFNMAYALSRQLAAMVLNVRLGALPSSAIVMAQGTRSGGASGYTTLRSLVDEADAELALHGFTNARSPWRTYQERLKTALDYANNNVSFWSCGRAP